MTEMNLNVKEEKTHKNLPPSYIKAKDNKNYHTPSKPSKDAHKPPKSKTNKKKPKLVLV